MSPATRSPTERCTTAHALRKYCMRAGPCRFGLPHERNDRMAIAVHPLATPPTDRIEDWQVVALPPTTSLPPPEEGER